MNHDYCNITYKHPRMISYKRTGIKTESDIYRESGNNRKTREIKIPEPKERNSSSSQGVRAQRAPEQEYKISSIWTCKFRIVRSDLMSVCVCVKGKVFVNNNASNNNMITEMKHNKNVKNKDMNDI